MPLPVIPAIIVLSLMSAAGLGKGAVGLGRWPEPNGPQMRPRLGTRGVSRHWISIETW